MKSDAVIARAVLLALLALGAPVQGLAKEVQLGSLAPNYDSLIRTVAPGDTVIIENRRYEIAADLGGGGVTRVFMTNQGHILRLPKSAIPWNGRPASWYNYHWVQSMQQPGVDGLQVFFPGTHHSLTERVNVNFTLGRFLASRTATGPEADALLAWALNAKNFANGDFKEDSLVYSGGRWRLIDGGTVGQNVGSHILFSLMGRGHPFLDRLQRALQRGSCSRTASAAR
ncbi:MAG: hypothetical protein K2X47_03005 [Bdellovibrionales bacterium]|nr:hypothetical protein [Bdellovibrionales bacterium]